jgi:hypothetical protein
VFVRLSLGATSGKPKPPSNSILYWIYEGISPLLSISATANCTMSTSSIS